MTLLPMKRCRDCGGDASDWLVYNTTARDRRAFGFWTLVFAAVGSVFFGRTVLWVTLLSLVALIPNVTSETPVEGQSS